MANETGCLSIFLLPFLLFFGGYNTNVAPSVDVEVPIVEATSSERATYTLTYISEVPLSDEAWQMVHLAVEQRLRIWEQSEFADSGVAIEPLFDVRLGDDTLIIQLYGDFITTNDVDALLMRGGYLELVDLSGVSQDVLAEYTGREIMTTARIVREGIEEGGMIVFPTVIDSDGFVTALALASDFGGYMVEVTLTDASAQALGDFTIAHIGQPLAIVLDGIVLSVPVVQSRIESPVIISGNFSEDEAQTLALQLNSIPLDATLILQSIGAE